MRARAGGCDSKVPRKLTRAAGEEETAKPWAPLPTLEGTAPRRGARTPRFGLAPCPAHPKPVCLGGGCTTHLRAQAPSPWGAKIVSEPAGDPHGYAGPSVPGPSHP